MKTLKILAAIALMAVTYACTTAADKSSSTDKAIEDLNMGLSKTSVFDVPTPDTYTYKDGKPGYNDRLAKAWAELPPQIPHRVEEFLRPGQVFGDELGHLVAVPSQATLGPFQGQPGPVGDELAGRSSLYRSEVGGHQLVDRGGLAHNHTAAIGAPGEDHVLTDRIRISRVPEFE